MEKEQALILSGEAQSKLCQGRPVVLAISLMFLLLFVRVYPVQSANAYIKLKHGQTSLCVKGQFTKRRPERYYTIYARAGQQMRVEVLPVTADLNTEGSVKFPHSELEPGNPGGVVFDETLPKDGIYRIRVGQRFNEKKIGRFILKIKTH